MREVARGCRSPGKSGQALLLWCFGAFSVFRRPMMMNFIRTTGAVNGNELHVRAFRQVIGKCQGITATGNAEKLERHENVTPCVRERASQRRN